LCQNGGNGCTIRDFTKNALNQPEPRRIKNDQYIECKYFDFKINNHGKIIIDELNKIMWDKIKFLILKIGANDTTTLGGLNSERKIYFETQCAIKNSNVTGTSMLDYNSNNDIRAIQREMKNIFKVIANINDDEMAFICVDPEKPSDYLFASVNDDDIRYAFQEKINNISNKTMITSCFPLAPYEIDGIVQENHDGNKIINYFINYTGTLILVNALGSECYYSIKKILDGRKNKITYYWVMVNDPTAAQCNTSIPYYNIL
jgi:hypothetical protein